MTSIGSIIGVALGGGLLASACIMAPPDASEGPVESAQAADETAPPADTTYSCGNNDVKCSSNQRCCIDLAGGGNCIPQTSKCPEYTTGEPSADP
jgi:hypothetical protein